jgi:hypothetical protein
LPSTPVSRLSIEGFVAPTLDGGYALRGVAVRADGRTGLNTPVIARLAGGTRVQLIGDVERGLSVVPSTIIAPDTVNPLVGGAGRPGTMPPAATQDLRGVYGRGLEPSMRPQGPPQRPDAAAPTERPNPPMRPNVPVRPESPVRPEAPIRPEAPTRPVRPGTGG